MNLHSGGIVIEPMADVHWLSHPGPDKLSDVAVTPFWINTDIVDQLYIPFLEPLDERLRERRLISSIPLGAEIFAVGLFKNHFGRERNTPLVRIGNLAALPEEPVHTKYAGDIEAYLVELRSLAGLSGSPVFLNPQYKRTIRAAPLSVFDDYIFLGLIHGHFDLQDVRTDSVADVAGNEAGAINTGIGVVVPSRLIHETLYQKDNIDQMIAQLKRYRAEGATPDVGVIERARNGFDIPV
jgi:hypothetical protein